MMNAAPPKRWVPLLELVVSRMKTGRMMLSSNDRRFLTITMKSARNSEERTSWSGGGAVDCWLFTDLAPGKADEHVLQSHFTAGDLPNGGVVLVLLDQVPRRLGGQQGAMVD